MEGKTLAGTLPRYQFSENNTISRQIYTFLRLAIVENVILPGSRLSENELAAHFGVSRQPVREALMRLNQCGLIRVQPQKGTFVNKISSRNLLEICFVRSAIECNAVRNGMRLPDAQFNAIVERMSRNIAAQHRMCDMSGHHARFFKLDDEFHYLICEMSNTALAWNVIQDIKANMDRIRFLTIDEISPKSSVVDFHDQVYEAIKRKDEESAVKLLQDHLFVITKTWIPARERHAEWFVDDEGCADAKPGRGRLGLKKLMGLN